MLSRAYSLLTVKSVDEDAREIVGIASTPEPDRLGDIIEPKGAEFKLPLPLLWQHRSSEPIGHVTHAKVTASGIEVRAKFVKIDEPGKLKDRLDEAWQSVKAGLVQGLSIGFTAIESARIEQTYAYRFTKWLWLELSVVTIPANGDCSIQAIKSIDALDIAASGNGLEPVPPTSPRVRGTVVARSLATDRTVMKTTIKEQIASFTAAREKKVSDRDALIDASAETGSTLDAAQGQQYDDLEAEIKALDVHIARLETREAENLAAAKDVTKSTTVADASANRSTHQRITVQPNVEPGIEFARAVMCKIASFVALQKGDFVSPIQVAKQRYPDSPRVHQFLEQKTAVAAGTTTDSTWAAPLLAQSNVLASEFLEFLRPATIIGKFGTTVNGVSIPSLRRVPFNVTIGSQTVGGTSSWVGQGKGKPVTKFGYANVTLLFTKIAGITVITEELARFSSPSAETLVRDQLAATVIERMDEDFIDPAIAEISGVRPASITYGLTPKTSAGTSAANVLTDMQNLLEPFLVEKVPVGSIVLIMPETLAMVLSLQLNALGQRAFPTLETGGGKLAGFPVITTQYAANQNQYGNMVIAVNARDIALADDGQVTVDASREASIEMSDAPTNESATPTANAYTVSMFQSNSIALRAERYINWKKLRSNAVVLYDDVNWGSVGSPGR